MAPSDKSALLYSSSSLKDADAAPQQGYVPGGVTRRLSLAVFAAVLGMFSYGYNLGVINNPQGVIKAFYNETNMRRSGSPISQHSLTLLWGFTVAVFAVGGMLGGLMSGWWADRFGRKRGMLINVGFGVVAGLFMACSKLARSYEMIIIGRFIVGFHNGLYTNLVPLYIFECAPSHIRGAIGTLNQLAVVIGLLISQVFGLSSVMGTAYLWPLLLGLTAVPAILQLWLLPFAPESPRYLLLVQGLEEKAVQALRLLRGTDNVSEEIEMMRQEKLTEDSEEKVGFLELLRSKSLRLPLFVCLIMHVSQQFSGINVIFYYSNSLFRSLSLDASSASYATLSVGCIMVVMTIVSIPLIDRAGRRTLHLTGLGGIFFSSILFTITFSLRDKADALKYVSITFALLIVVFFAIGPGSIPWMIVAEVFPQGPRPAAVSLGVLVNWISNFVVAQSFPPLEQELKSLVFIPFTVLTGIFFVILFKLLPETKNRTVEEIAQLFSKGQTTSYKSYGGLTDPEPSDSPM